MIDQEYKRIQELINEKRFEQVQGETFYCISGTTIKDSPGISRGLGHLPYGSRVKILDQTDDHYKIIHNDTTGWVIKAALYSEADYNEYIGFIEADAKSRQEGALKAQQTKEAEQAKRKTDLIKRYGTVTAQKILDRKIWLGMTDDMAIESWGRPVKVNRTVGTWGVHEQWAYGDEVYLYFENSKLTSWQD